MMTSQINENQHFSSFQGYHILLIIFSTYNGHWPFIIKLAHLLSGRYIELIDRPPSTYLNYFQLLEYQLNGG